MKIARNPREEQPDIMTKQQFRNLLSAMLALAAATLFIVGLFSGHLQSKREYLAAAIMMVAAVTISIQFRKAR